MARAEDTPAADLDDLIRRVDPDRWLSSRFVVDPLARADVVAIYAFDHELARAPKVASNPLLGEIRLTWWGEALDEIFEDRPVRRHPGAQALAEAVRRRGLERAPLERMIEARYRELEPAPMSETEAVEWARGTGGEAARIAAGVLDPGANGELGVAAGAAWALARRVPAQDALRPAFERTLAEARSAVRALSPPAFPAVAHAALARERARGAEVGPLAGRLRLIFAVARGRL